MQRAVTRFSDRSRWRDEQLLAAALRPGVGALEIDDADIVTTTASNFDRLNFELAELIRRPAHLEGPAARARRCAFVKRASGSEAAI
jgi:hypothetical protein